MKKNTGFSRGSRDVFSKADRVETWLHSLIDQFCDIQPDKGNSTRILYLKKKEE
jgi:hypothetical protein